MPPRWLCFGVIVFWLAATGWLVWCEVRDEFTAEEPPPFVIDLVDEAQPQQGSIRWVVWQGDESPDLLIPLDVRRDTVAHFASLSSFSSPAAFASLTAIAVPSILSSRMPGSFRAESWIRHHEKADDFTLHVRFEPKNTRSGWMDLELIKLKRMDSVYRVDRAGRLLGTYTDFLFDLPGVEDVSVLLEGEVRGGQFYGKYAFSLGFLRQEQEMPPVPVSRRGSVLLPMHPVNRLRGLRPGQSWKLPLVNPLADALASLTPVGGHSGPHTLTAHVLPELHPLPPISQSELGGWKPYPCLVIEYDSSDEESNQKVKPRTWVRATDGLVLRQEAEVFGKRLVMQRDVIPEAISEP